MERRKELIQLVLGLFKEQGVDFNMDAVASGMKMSKKTIYKEYGRKEDLIVLIVKAIFEGIENRLDEILKDESLDIVEKLILVSCAHPDSKNIDYQIALTMKNDFPAAYHQFIHYIEDHWDTKELLYKQGIQEAKLLPIDFSIYRCILLGTIKEVLEKDMGGEEELLEHCVRQIVRGFRS
jgi:AcrR family transcriptional regulator